MKEKFPVLKELEMSNFLNWLWQERNEEAKDGEKLLLNVVKSRGGLFESFLLSRKRIGNLHKKSFVCSEKYRKVSDLQWRWNDEGGLVEEACMVYHCVTCLLTWNTSLHVPSHRVCHHFALKSEQTAHRVLYIRNDDALCCKNYDKWLGIRLVMKINTCNVLYSVFQLFPLPHSFCCRSLADEWKRERERGGSEPLIQYHSSLSQRIIFSL